MTTRIEASKAYKVPQEHPTITATRLRLNWMNAREYPLGKDSPIFIPGVLALVVMTTESCPPKGDRGPLHARDWKLQHAIAAPGDVLPA
jgi:hypothetical protein